MSLERVFAERKSASTGYPIRWGLSGIFAIPDHSVGLKIGGIDKDISSQLPLGRIFCVTIRFGGFVEGVTGIDMLGNGGFPSVFHSVIENNIGRTSEDDRTNQQYYRNDLSKGAFIVIDLFLYFCSCKSVGYCGSSQQGIVCTFRPLSPSERFRGAVVCS